MKAIDILLEKTNTKPVKPRNFVAKNAGKTTSGAGKHKDRKKAQKQGETKHKGKIDEVIAFSPGYGGKSPYNRSGTARKKTSSMLNIIQSINKKEQEKKAEKQTKVKEISDWGEPKELLSDVMSALERQVEWPLTDVMDRQEVQNLLQPVRNAINAKIKNIGQGVQEGDELDEKYLDKVISDLYKDVYGMRPDHEFGREWMSSNYKEKLEIYKSILKNLHSDIDEGIGGTIAGGVGQFIGNKIDPLHGEILRSHGELAGRKAEYTIRKYMNLLSKALKQQLGSKEKTEGFSEAGYNPLDYERDQIRQMDYEKKAFKRAELQHELGHEDDPDFERKMMQKQMDRDQGPWYLKIDGKIYKQKGKPKVFNWKKGANNYALAILKNRPDLKDKIFITKNLSDDVAETATTGSMSSGDFSVGAVYPNKKGKTYKNKDGTTKNALDIKGGNLLTGGSIAKR